MLDLTNSMNMIYTMVQYAFPLSIIFVIVAKIINIFMCFVFGSKIKL